jgi:aldehyde dehydrogenase (NAD+)
MQAIFAQQARAKYAIASTDAATRIAKLERLKAAVLEHAEAAKQALYTDIGKPVTAELPMEVGLTVLDIDDAIAHLAQWMQPQPVPLAAVHGSSTAFIQYEARGQVLILSAWNFPFSLALSPLIAAIAAGNVAMVKTNEMCPATGEVVAAIVAACFDVSEVAVFTGGIDETLAIQELPFEHIFFTGSPAVGKQVMAAAAKHLASVTLELGGKCPAIVGPDADLATAIQNIAIGRTFNLGQTCLCIDYAIVHESVLEALVQGVTQALQDLYYEGDEYQSARNSRIVDTRNFNRVKGYIEDAIARGATVAAGGKTAADTLIIEPTLLLNVPEDALIMRNEVFGPVLAVVPYKNREDVLDIVRRRGKPLGLYIYAQDQTFIDFVVHNTSSGGVSVNGWASHYFESGLPFGGVNQSGQGSYHGVHGFIELSHAKAVFQVKSA